MKRIPSLDGFRAISIILVVVSHIRDMNEFKNIPIKYNRMFSYGGVGVTVFFVISGFLITYLLLNEQSNNGNISLKRFYINRALRILPVFFLYISFILIWRTFENFEISKYDILHVFTFTVRLDGAMNWYFSHFWSLSIEEQFYIFWPVTLIFFRKNVKTVLVVLIVYSCISRIIDHKYPGYRLITLSPFFKYSDSLFIGALGAIFLFEFPWLSQLKIFRSYLLQIPALVLICLFVYMSHGKFPYLTLPFANVIISACILYLMLSYITPSNNLVFKFLNSKVMVHIGILSYSMYIWQQFFFKGAITGIWRAFPYNFIMIYLAALASYYLWERPFLKLKKSFAVKKTEGFQQVHASNER